jgi:DNA-binding transcriptional LysR family regulator
MSLDVDIRLLRSFAVLARVGSFTRTAAQMNVTQSAISHGMRRLEAQLGCSLFYKKGKSAHLTPEGRIFLSQVLRILDGVDRAAESVSGRFSDSKGTLSVIFSTSLAHAILAPVLREFRESYPRMSVVVRLEDTPRAMEKLEEGRCDLALLVDDKPPAGIRTHALFSDQLQFVLSPRHPWRDKKRLSAAEMSREHFLLYRRNSVTFRRAEDFFLKAGVRLESYVEIPSFEIMKELAKLGLGVGLMAPWVVEKEIQEGSLVGMPTPRFGIRRRWVVAYQGNRELRQPEQTFIGLCRMACRPLSGAGG